MVEGRSIGFSTFADEILGVATSVQGDEVPEELEDNCRLGSFCFGAIKGRTITVFAWGSWAEEVIRKGGGVR